MEDKKPEDSAVLLGPAGPIGPGAVGQLRQLSIPLWARILTLCLAVGTLLGGSFLVWQGWVSCTVGCNEKWIENGTKIVGSAFVPVIVLVYLVFAETGVKALVRKTEELLKRTIPSALRIETESKSFGVVGAIERCDVDTIHTAGAPTARYTMTFMRLGAKGRLDVIIDLNVSKANVAFFIPVPEEFAAGTDIQQLRERFKATMEGAEHEGYVFDKASPEVEVDGRRYLKIVARRRLSDNFLWDPGHKLHFAQDLRMFVHSMILDGWDIMASA